MAKPETASTMNLSSFATALYFSYLSISKNKMAPPKPIPNAIGHVGIHTWALSCSRAGFRGKRFGGPVGTFRNRWVATHYESRLSRILRRSKCFWS
jgi:hypothetical protein